MLLFGIGYRNDVHPLRTLIVMNEGDPLQPQVENMATSLGQNIIYKGVTSDKDAAMQELRRGNVDLVVVIPPDALETIRSNQQATVQFYHNEIDPYQVSYMEYFGRAYIDEANRRIVRGYAERGAGRCFEFGTKSGKCSPAGGGDAAGAAGWQCRGGSG